MLLPALVIEIGGSHESVHYRLAALGMMPEANTVKDAKALPSRIVDLVKEIAGDDGH